MPRTALGTGDAKDSGSSAAGLSYALGAYLFWGFVPLYFKEIAHVPALQILMHRVIWSVLLLGALMAIRGRWRVALQAMRSWRTAAVILCTTVLIAINWLVFIWAIANDRVLEAGLGYYINPLVSVLLGTLLLRERLRRLSMLAVALATFGVGYLVYEYGEVPWVALVLATSFGMYGMLRKVVRIEALAGLTMEITILLPAALAYLIYLSAVGESVFGLSDLRTSVLLVCAGAVTSVPLLWFTNAARRLRLSTMGFMQYIAPTIQVLLATLKYAETFSRAHLVCFAFIWGALILYSIDQVRSVPRFMRSRAKPVRL